MAYEEITALLGGWEGFELVGVRREPATAPVGAAQILLTLRPLASHPKRREVVIVAVEDKETNLACSMYILRPEHGKPILSEPAFDGGASATGGRFSCLLKD